MLGEPAQDFELVDLDGEAFRLSEAKGKPVLLYFWATWCLPCREVGPIVEMLARSLGPGGFVAAGVNVKGRSGPVKAYQRTNGYTFRTLLDSGAVQEQFAVDALPTIILIGRMEGSSSSTPDLKFQ